MAISGTTTKSSASANGTQHSFAYGFKIFANGDLTVIVRSATGSETVKVLDTDYIVTNAGNANGGNVLFKFNTGNSSDAHFSSTDKRPQSGETVLIRRNLTLTQGTDYVENDPFPAASHEDALDRLTMITQQIQENVDRSIQLSRTNTMTSTEFTVGATDRANKILAFDSSGEISVTQELGTFRGNWAASTAYAIRDLVKDTSTNNIFIVNTAHTSSGSQPLTTNANSAKYTLLVDAATATTQASNAASSATAASNSATAAGNSATAAANTLTTFQGQYHGAASSNPSSNLDAGDLYFNTTDGELRVYTGSAWISAKPTATEQANINALGQSDVIADMALLATTDVIADMALLANADVIADMNTLATADIVSDLNTLATSDIVSDLNTLATSDIVSDLNTLATSDIVSDINTLATSDIVSDLNTLATSDIVADLNILATSANVTNMATLGASGVVANIATVAGDSTDIGTVATNINNVNTVAQNISTISAKATKGFATAMAIAL